MLPRARFSSTVRVRKMLRPSGTSTSPSRHSRSGAWPLMRVPWKLIVPAKGDCSPATVLSSVDLPAPLGPTTKTISPFSTVRSTPSSAVSRPYPAFSPSTFSIASPCCRRLCRGPRFRCCLMDSAKSVHSPQTTEDYFYDFRLTESPPGVFLLSTVHDSTWPDQSRIQQE